MQCKVCGQDNPPEAGFCGNCGAVLATTAEPATPEAIPTPPTVTPEVQAEYIGFWVRFVAAIIDAIILGAVYAILSIPVFLDLMLFPPLRFSLFLLSWLYFWLFTGLKGQTPGKMVVGIKVVNVRGEKPELFLAAVREILGKFISGAVFCLGYLWIAIDEEKRGWHDSIANTHVVKVEPKE
ncbi:MAG TPA: hypothetical protein G4O18_03165 [Dehalococcoidia bacterium]|nr:hypothetical protein [Dehalococcoidia bacterium]